MERLALYLRLSLEDEKNIGDDKEQNERRGNGSGKEQNERRGNESGKEQNERRSNGSGKEQAERSNNESGKEQTGKNGIESSEEQDESNSIGNQRKQIQEYIHRDLELCRYEAVEFVDDGYSGTNMNRPGIQKLLKEVKANKIQCIIVKDMSRFSRDYIEMGTYLNQIFPFMGIRFIAINDHYDSREHQGSTIEIDTAFQTLLYDLYSKDISVKVKASFDNKCANGEYVFGQVPFGYAKSREVKNTVIVKENEAEIVRYIFSLAVKGKSSTQIARQLYAEKVPTITQLRMPQKQYQDGKIHSWSESAVRRILNNRFYLGEMAYGKSVRKSVGSKSSLSVPRDRWKVIPKHHEALVSEDMFKQAHFSRSEHSKMSKDFASRHGERHPLTGKLFCGGCGYSLIYKPLLGKNCHRRFECRKHALLQIPECCTYVNADALEEAIILLLNKEILLLGDTVKQREKLSAFQQWVILALRKKLEAYSQEKRQLQLKKDILYESYALHRLDSLSGLSGEEYRKKADELDELLSALAVKSDETAGKLAELEGAMEMGSEYWKAEVTMQESIRYLRVKELTWEAANTFIRKVYVYKDKRVEIEWNFAAMK